ncbi:MAG: hypothetical protein LBN37_06020 [Bacteroidales bacterium]|jgi:hypothetical protein|nr:hypothetical protein [Bacteroidales bacterium]
MSSEKHTNAAETKDKITISKIPQPEIGIKGICFNNIITNGFATNMVIVFLPTEAIVL